jgi:glucose-1-phosphatase
MLVCFDLGRVLVRICENWRDAYGAAGLVGTPPEPDAATSATIGARVHAFEAGKISVADFNVELARLLGRSEREMAAMLDAWLLGTYPGAAALLDALSRNGRATACLSNTNARHWELMSSWKEGEGLLSRLGQRYASHELGLRKPDAAIYGEVERQSGFAPEQILFFDDLADNVAAARARGWQAMLVKSRHDPVAEMRVAIESTLGPLG